MPLSSFPKISIVTPSYNQGRFLDTTMRSILEQDYPNLEYIVMDGGSTDNSVEIIRNYQDRLAYWQSQKDRGQNHAITEGFKRATGDIFAYLNSDDIYLPWTLRVVSQIFSQLPRVEWLTTRTTMVIDADGDPIMTNAAIQYSRRRFFSGFTLRDVDGESGWIQQEATFWRPSLWERAGAQLDENAYRTGDFELWSRFFRLAPLTTTRLPLAAFRMHNSNKTQLDVTIQECRAILARFPQEPRYSLAEFRMLNRLRRRGGRTRAYVERHYGEPVQWVEYDYKTGSFSIRTETIV